MEENRQDTSGVMAFDALYTTNQMQKLKVLLPYIEPSMQKHLAVYIKYQELRYTLRHTREHPFTLCGCGGSQPEKPDFRGLCRELCRYCGPEEIRQLEQLGNLFQTMETMQEMSQTMSAMQELFPGLLGEGMDGLFSSGESASLFGDANSGESPLLSMLMNMLTPKQREMYDMFHGSELSPGDDN